MKDMIPLGTGNSRFLKSVENFKALYPTYDAFVAALVAGTLPVDFNGVNPDGVQQIGTALNKLNLLKDETAAMYGLDNSAVPNDAFAELGKYKQHWWEVNQESASGYDAILVASGLSENNTLLYNFGREFNYSHSVSVDQETGSVSLANPQRFSADIDLWVGTSMDDDYLYNVISSDMLRLATQVAALAPCYIQDGKRILYLPEGATAGWEVSNTIIAGMIEEELEDDDGETYTEYAGRVCLNKNVKKASSERWETGPGKLFYVHSADRSAYPDGGVVAGYRYRYIGVPFDKAVYDTHRVGAIASTTRTSLGESWLLANGAYITREDYPLLWDVLMNSDTDFQGMFKNVSTSETPDCIYAYNGMWVFSGSSGSLYYSTDISTGFTRNGNVSYQFEHIHCHEGLWVAVRRSGTNQMTVYWTNDPTGKWTSKAISTNGEYPRGIGYGNGKWVIVATSDLNESTLFVHTSDDPTTGTWTSVQTTFTKVRPYGGVVYSNGFWVVGGIDYASPYPAVVWVATDPTGAWDQFTVSPESVNVSGTGIGVQNGKFGLFYSKMNSFGTYDLFFSTATDPTGEWEHRVLSLGNKSAYVVGRFMNGLWVATIGNSASEERFVFSEDVDGDFIERGLGMNVYAWCEIAVENGTVALAGNGAIRYNTKDIFSRKLPTLSSSGVYTYIKAKEDV